MREVAEAATPGPWEADTSEVYGPGYDDEGHRDWIGETSVLGNESLTAANSAHIASWHPAVVLAVAKVLEARDGAATYDEWHALAQAVDELAATYLGRSS